MDFQFYVEKLMGSDEFVKFRKEKNGAYFCGGFIGLGREDVKKKKDDVHIDYYVPSEKKIYSFNMENGVVLVPQENYDGRIPEKMNDNVEFDFDEVVDMLEKELVEKQINNTIKKAVLSLQSLDGKAYLVGTLFLNNMALAKIQINLESKKVVELEKKSFFDILKRG